jgi:hypothetical protein
VTAWTRRGAARRASGMYLVFPAGEPGIDWDRKALDALGSCNQPMALSEEFSPLFEIRLGKTRIRSRAQIRNRAPWWRFWRRYRIAPVVIHA